MDRDKIIYKVSDRLNVLDSQGKLFLDLEPQKVPEFLSDLRTNLKLDNETLGDFIQEILITKFQVIKRRPELKDPLLKFVKDNRILGIHF